MFRGSARPIPRNMRQETMCAIDRSAQHEVLGLPLESNLAFNQARGPEHRQSCSKATLATVGFELPCAGLAGSGAGLRLSQRNLAVVRSHLVKTRLVRAGHIDTPLKFTLSRQRIVGDGEFHLAQTLDLIAQARSLFEL
jgi:hypothetical protein